MFKSRLTFLILFIAFTAFSWADSKPSILILPLENNKDEDTQFRVISHTVDETLSLTLQLLGEFELVDAGEELAEMESVQALYAWAADKGIDNVISGTMTVDSFSGIDFAVTLYDPVSKQTKDQVESRADGILDVFDATDSLIAELVGSFSDSHVGFGSLAFVLGGIPADYTVYLGDVLLGKNAEGRDRVLIGDYDLTVKQWRLGQEKVVYSTPVSIQEFEETEIEIELPDLLPEEKQWLDEQYNLSVALYTEKGYDTGVFPDKDNKEKMIKLYGNNGEINESGLILARTIAYLEEMGSSMAIDEELFRFNHRNALWKLKREWWRLEERPFSMTTEDLTDSIALYNSADEYEDSGAIRINAQMNGRLFAHVNLMHAAHELNTVDFETALGRYETIIDLGRSLGSETGFGFSGEYNQVKEMLETPNKSDAWKRGKIGRWMRGRLDYYKYLKDEERKNVSRKSILLFSEDEDIKFNLSFLPLYNPYIYTYQLNAEKGRYFVGKNLFNAYSKNIPLSGRYTAEIYPAEDPEAERPIDEYKGWNRFNWYLGSGSLSQIYNQWEIRFGYGRIGVGIGLESGYYHSLNDPSWTTSIPFHLNFYPIMRRRWEVSLGYSADTFATSVGHDYYDYMALGFKLGLIVKFKNFDVFIDNRLHTYPLQAELVADEYSDDEYYEYDQAYSPVIGVRLLR